jgi:hypothetical protein
MDRRGASKIMSDETVGLEERRLRAAESLLRLISQDELRKLAIRISADRDSLESVAARLAQLPRFAALEITLSVAEPTLIMLRDILSFLDQHGIAARTTGCSLYLAEPIRGRDDRIDLSPQEVGALAAWTPKPRRSIRDNVFAEALADWRSLIGGWEELLWRARMRFQQGEIDVTESLIEQAVVYEPDEDVTDYAAVQVLSSLAEPLSKLSKLLEALPESDRPVSCETLLDEIRYVQHHVESTLEEVRYRGTTHYESKQLSISDDQDCQEMLQFVDQQFLDMFNRISEDIYLLSDLIYEGSILDIMNTAVWSSRPQLYEVWLLVMILDWLEQRGYHVDILKIVEREDRKYEWQLAYAKDKTPCARVVGGVHGSCVVYYQLYQRSGDMPDLCLFPEPREENTPLWAIDAKHSDKASYTLSTYRATATRYRDSFGAESSIVVEYFPRADIRGLEGDYIAFGPGASLVCDAAPDGRGIAKVFGVLDRVHPSVRTTLVCIDLSESFRSTVDAALEEARALLRGGDASVSDKFVCFADVAVTMTGMKSFIDGNANKLHVGETTRLGNSTMLEPLRRELRRVIGDTPNIELLLLSDGDFSDGADALKSLSADFGASVRVMP